MTFVTMWMDPKDIFLREISQRKTNAIGSYWYVESKKQNEQNRTERHRVQTADFQRGGLKGLSW